jgi:hypothetical protein
MPARVASIHVLRQFIKQDVDGRDRPGHDGAYSALMPFASMNFVQLAISLLSFVSSASGPA